MERESETVAQSGRSGAVTIATNMAGRGTDIILGGNPEFMARLKLREMLMPRVVSQIEGENVLSRSSTTKVWPKSTDLPRYVSCGHSVLVYSGPRPDLRLIYGGSRPDP